ncbi:MAG: phosphotransferase family protein [Rhodobiaceae bacterium]|nr:phosphotransferase family protein [Rhodobiaceae bacterium]
MSELIDKVHAALVQAPDFAAVPRAGLKAERLGGLTNLVHKVATPSGNVIVRIPGEGTEDYIDRAVEAHNAQVAAETGVSPAVLFADPVSGIMITRAIEDIVTMTGDLFKARAGSPARAGKAFKALHSSGKAFRFRFELFSMIADYLGVLATRTVDLPDGYHDVVEAAKPVREALERNPVALAPCHCDPLCENFLDDGQRMWIVDWEYSGMNDPYWDLGDLSVEAGFDEAQDMEMMRAWCGGEPRDAEMARMIIYKAMCDLLWTLWGLIQHADGNPAEDFWAYSVGRFERCKALMESPAFPGYVAALDEG